MTDPFLRASWVAAAGEDAVRRYAAAVADSSSAGRTAAYSLTAKTPVMASITSRLEHLGGATYPVLPTHLILTDVESLESALALEEQVPRPDEFAVTIVVSGLYREVATVIGVLGPPDDGPAAAIQFGTFNMHSAADEEAISRWYATRRLPSFAAIDGGYRARRWVSVIGGPARLGVLYEFRSLQDRVDHFEPLETVDHDEDQPTAATRTVHPPMSPSVGALLLPEIP